MSEAKLEGRGQVIGPDGKVKFEFILTTEKPKVQDNGSDTHTTAVRNGIADYVVDAIDTGGAGTLEIRTSGDVEVATLTFGVTAFGAAASGTATANAITSDTSATGGTAAKFAVINGSATEIFYGSVTATSGGGDIELSSVAIGAGDTVSISSLTYSAPA